MNQKYTGAKNLNHQHQIDLMIQVIMAGNQDLEKNREHIDLEQNQSQEKECLATK